MTYIPTPESFKTVSLEISLKAFFDNTTETRRAVCRKMFRQWISLCEHADEVHVMLWAADGTEILDYRGDLDVELEWARYLGGASRLNETQNSAKGDEIDPDGIGLYWQPYLYRENPAVFTYRWLKGLVEDMKREGEHILELPIKVGTIFDPGPEFSKSSFKYERHPEICLGGPLYGKTFVGCAAILKGDSVAYSGFPDGIPDGTTIGTFLGRQLRYFNPDLGFDFIWFSNGFGFGIETWGLNGALFDGYRFMPGKTEKSANGIRKFWQDFRQEVPDLLVRTRGTNMTTGIDLASDAVPLSEIYEYGPLEPPVNSPWAALNGDFGLELAGWMSHIAELPGEGFPFRFYTHDPWWVNSPWIDRYQRFPHDLYMPLAVGRLNHQGKIETPNSISFLTVDDSKGEMPAQVAAEVTAHVLRARENSPDQPGPLLWVYPFAEYHEAVFSDKPQLEEVYFGDWYIRGAINQGAPINTVVSTQNYRSIAAHRTDRLSGSILLTPVPRPGSPLRKQLLEQAHHGGRVLFYGPIAHDDTELLALLALEPAAPAQGDFELTLQPGWEKSDGVAYSSTLHHAAIISGGPLTLALAKQASEYLHVLATATHGEQSYPVALLHEPPGWNGGRLGWVRGTVSCDETHMENNLPYPLDTAQFFPAESMVRLLVAQMGGFEALHEKMNTKERTPIHTVSRSRNGFFFSGYNVSEVGVHLRMPHGAPLFTGTHATLSKKGAHYQLPPAWHHECRVFVQQSETSKVECRELPSIAYGVNRRLLVTNLKNATVRFFPVRDTEKNVAILAEPSSPYLVGKFIDPRTTDVDDGVCLEFDSFSGDVLFSW